MPLAPSPLPLADRNDVESVVAPIEVTVQPVPLFVLVSEAAVVSGASHGALLPVQNATVALVSQIVEAFGLSDVGPTSLDQELELLLELLLGLAVMAEVSVGEVEFMLLGVNVGKKFVELSDAVLETVLLVVEGNIAVTELFQEELLVMVGLARDSELFPPVAVGWKEMLYWDQALTTPAVMFQSSQAEAVVKLVADVVVLLLQNGAELVMFSFDDEFDMDAVPVALGPVVNGPKTPEPDVKLDEAEVLEELRPLPLLDTDDGIVDVVLPLSAPTSCEVVEL